MKTSYDIIRRPIITEKSALLAEKAVYTFEVAKEANKVEIKKAIEEIFEVKVVAIRTVNVHRKPKRMSRYEGFKSAYKKAIVRLEPGQTIKAFEV
ncbi:MAG: 50S ribosomal protein L23 [Bacilli bacterium]|jgi:large subunit ribosomal protein L23|nr:50S ribosomal protein L23 [Bacilli bacterium]